MKILYTGTLYLSAGGPAYSTYHTMQGLNALGEKTSVLMYDRGSSERLIGSDVDIIYAPHPIERTFAYSPSYKRLVRNCPDVDIYHAQGVWQYPTYALASVARSLHKPYLITPRGMLYPQDIAKSNTFFKKLSLRLRLLHDLNHAACVHVTCDDEMRYCRDLGVTAPICVIPNPVDVHIPHSHKTDNTFRLGYLGRISRRKNVESLIYAWAALGDKASAAELLIIGGGDDDYMAFLRREVQRLNLSNVRFTGFISGQEKEDALASLSVLAMPSEFENFGNVIVEALVRGIPCIATKGAPWQDLQTHNCGWWVDFSQNAINNAVAQALDTPADKLAEMGAHAISLVNDKYSIESVAKALLSVYNWIIAKADKPGCVSLF